MIGKSFKLVGVSLASTLMAACGGAESDPKINQSLPQPQSQSISGIALDGYLYKAKVCLDKNNNAICDNADGDIITTDDKGRFTLNIDNDADKYSILVEAVPGLTIDMDKPHHTIESGFTLEVPSVSSKVVSPITLLISSVSKTSGISFDEATQLVASELQIDKQLVTSDYSIPNSEMSRQIHMLARGMTRVLQKAQAASLEAGANQVNARKGTMLKLAELDLKTLKKETDKIPHDVTATEDALKQIGNDFYNHIKVSNKDIGSNGFVVKPPTPKSPKGGSVNDASDTFDWELVRGFKQLSDYEYSLDSGQTWETVTNKPLNVGKEALEKGAVQIRVAASKERNLPAGPALVSEKAYTLTPVPASPSSVTIDNATNQFDWALVESFQNPDLYEYSLDNGQSWQPVTEKPQQIDDIDIPKGHLKIRIAENEVLGHLAGLIAASDQPMTVTPGKPEAPTSLSADDTTNVLTWDYVDGYEDPSFYEIDLGKGWYDVNGLPHNVGNIDLSETKILIRVKSSDLDGRPAGDPSDISFTFTLSETQPKAPTTPKVDDIDDTFGWTEVTKFPGIEFYEYSIDSGRNFTDTTQNPQPIPEDAYEKGEVCVRVKASSSPQRDAGEQLCSDKPYTETPSAPDAPTQPISDDDKNTFDWTFVSGFDSKDDYEIQIESSGSWESVTSKPYQLEEKNYSIGSIVVRVKENVLTGRPAGIQLTNDKPFTVKKITGTCTDLSLTTAEACINILDRDGKLFTNSPSQKYLNSISYDEKRTMGVNEEFGYFGGPKGDFTTFNQSQADALCETYNANNLNGRSNWRLTTMKELYFLHDENYNYNSLKSHGWPIWIEYWSMTKEDGLYMALRLINGSDTDEYNIDKGYASCVSEPLLERLKF